MDMHTLVMAVTFLLAVAFVIWLFALASLLERNDLDPVTKFMWAFVVVVTFAVGAILYLLIAPKVQPASTEDGSEPRSPADDASEDATCVSCGATIPIGARACPKCGWSYGDAGPQ